MRKNTKNAKNAKKLPLSHYIVIEDGWERGQGGEGQIWDVPVGHNNVAFSSYNKNFGIVLATAQLIGVFMGAPAHVA